MRIRDGEINFFIQLSFCTTELNSSTICSIQGLRSYERNLFFGVVHECSVVLTLRMPSLQKYSNIYARPDVIDMVYGDTFTGLFENEDAFKSREIY